MATVSEPILIVRNPATGEELGRIEPTRADQVDQVVEGVRRAQASWRRSAWGTRREWLERWGARLAAEADAWADAIVAEVGKPRGEALAEVVMSVEAIRWTARHGGRVLAGERLGAGRQRWLLIPPARVAYQPVGVIGMIGTWNYPIYLNAPAIAQAVAAGNGVVWKPSELASLIGRRLQQSLEATGLPEGLVARVAGGPEVGRALVESAIDKGMFTGGIENGRRVIGELGRRGVPALAELSGFDAAIVLPDAHRPSTVRALTWGAFVGSGQACVAVKRVYVVGDAQPWAAALAEAAGALRIGDPARPDVDLGPLISTAARDRFAAYVQAAIDAGARVLTGQQAVPGPGGFVRPTVLLADSTAPESALEGVFGPVVVVRGVPDADSAVEAANAGRFGLSASVWSRNVRVARALGERLEVGVVTVNDAVAPTGHASAPFGGARASGFGRIKGSHGLLEFVQAQTQLVRGHRRPRPQCFPYSRRMERLLSAYLRLFHRSR
jgi:acyl-CoA reductase-like NAD-dependent aldehyde dehydrogenase